MQDDFDNDELHGRFMAGACHALALKIAEQTGWAMAVVWFHRGRVIEVGHIVAVPPDQAIANERNLLEAEVLDIGGLRGWPDIFSDLDFDPDEERAELAMISADEIRALTKGRGLRKLPALTDELMYEAEVAARQVLASIGYECSTLAL